MADSIAARDEVLNRIAKVFRDEGYEAASLARLAQASGLSKASLYYHFPNGKEEMAMAVIERANEMFTEQVIQPLRSNASASARIAQMVRNLDAYYCKGQESCLLGVLAMSATPAIFHPHIKRGLLEWINALTETLLDLGLPKRVARQRAEDAVCRVEGALLLVRGIADTGPFRRVLSLLPAQIQEPVVS